MVGTAVSFVGGGSDSAADQQDVVGDLGGAAIRSRRDPAGCVGPLDEPRRRI
ncbi:hypothetical protein [Nocardia sp. NPDC058480]|uniref:hypothetical protein n=1 Tax=Nocardia sp. NPDC058480 TaxID=3346522 RepID=UPI003669638B